MCALLFVSQPTVQMAKRHLVSVSLLAIYDRELYDVITTLLQVIVTI